jgi:hypothetical protein
VSQSRTGRGGDEKNSLPLWEMGPSRPACSLVTVLTELFLRWLDQGRSDQLNMHS